MSLTRDALLKPLQAKRVKVELPEFGEGQYVWVYGMSAGQHIAIERAMLTADGTKVDKSKHQEFKQRQVIASLRSDDGELLLTNEDIQLLSDWPSEVFERVHDAVFALAGKKVTEKNSDPTSD